MVHSQSWREAYSGLIGERVLHAQSQAAQGQWRERLSDPFGPSYWLAERGGAAVGLAWAEAVGPGYPRALELVALYVLASEYGTGTAAALLTAAIGDAPCMLWVARENTRALAFYRRHGFLPDGQERIEDAWDAITLVRLVR